MESEDLQNAKAEALVKNFARYVEVLNDSVVSAVKHIDCDVLFCDNELYIYAKVFTSPKKQINIYLLKLKNDATQIFGHDTKPIVKEVKDLKKKINDMI